LEPKLLDHFVDLDELILNTHLTYAPKKAKGLGLGLLFHFLGIWILGLGF
jgi:hypothetical protein